MAITIETERKFLLKKVPTEVDYDDIIDITQHYLKVDDKWERYRKAVHLNGDVKYYKTIKTFIKLGSSEEDETELTETNYNKLIELCKSGTFNSRVVDKKRYVYGISKNLKWEIDKFKGMNIVIAEIELPKIDSKFDTPDWLQNEIIMEVTEFKKLSSRSLATKL